MNGGDAGGSSTQRSKALVGAVTVLVVVLAVWGYLRGMFGQTFSVIQSVKQLAPQAEERNRLLEELTNQPKSAEPNRLAAPSGCHHAYPPLKSSLLITGLVDCPLLRIGSSGRWRYPKPRGFREHASASPSQVSASETTVSRRLGRNTTHTALPRGQQSSATASSAPAYRSP